MELYLIDCVPSLMVAGGPSREALQELNPAGAVRIRQETVRDR
jgi:hypothetical protein